MIKLSIIIVNYNVRYFLEQCLLSVKDACFDFSSEVIVVDNNSIDGSCEMIKDKFPQVKLISNQENVGFGKANNIGVSKAKGEYILFLNPDTYIAEDTLKKSIDFAERQNNFGALGVKMIDGTGSYLPESKRNIPTIKIASKKIMGNSKNYYANQINENNTGPVEILTGAFMLIKQKVYIEVGGFDSDYFMYGEDIDLSYKLLNKNYQNYYLGSSTIIHFKGESTTKNISYLKNFYGAMQIFYNKYFKINQFDYMIQKVVVKLLILVNSVKANNNIVVKEKRNIVIIGDKSNSYQNILDIVKPKKVKITKKFLLDFSEFDTVFFDQKFMSNSDIIKYFKAKQLQDVSKRIISKNSKFYLGSDTSSSKGEVVVF